MSFQHARHPAPVAGDAQRLPRVGQTRLGHLPPQGGVGVGEPDTVGEARGRVGDEDGPAVLEPHTLDRHGGRYARHAAGEAGRDLALGARAEAERRHGEADRLEPRRRCPARDRGSEPSGPTCAEGPRPGLCRRSRTRTRAPSPRTKGQISARKNRTASRFGACSKPPMNPIPRRSSKGVCGATIGLANGRWTTWARGSKRSRSSCSAVDTTIVASASLNISSSRARVSAAAARAAHPPTVSAWRSSRRKCRSTGLKTMCACVQYRCTASR